MQFLIAGEAVLATPLGGIGPLLEIGLDDDSALGGLLAAAGLYWGSSWWSSWLPDLPPVNPLYPGLSVIAMGALLGLLGSWTSLSRVLRAVGGR